ncbi:MAG: hypothetical protein GSR79_00910 [Desulfurococcales archaeon]|nr:hypothetical protein [Desulfurococcales archaeon]
MPEANELVKRIVSSLTSDLEAFVFHEDLINPDDVNLFLRRYGLGDILVLKNIGKGIYVLLLNEKRIESECLYIGCGSFRSKERDICVAKCKRKGINTIKTKLLKMLE